MLAEERDILTEAAEDEPNVAFLSERNEVRVRNRSGGFARRPSWQLRVGIVFNKLFTARSCSFCFVLSSAALVITLAVILLKKYGGSGMTVPDKAVNDILYTDSNCIYRGDRLPSSIIPVHYDLDLRTDEKMQNYSGSVSIYLNVSAATSTVILNAKELVVHSVRLNLIGDRAKRDMVRRTVLCNELEQLQVSSDQLTAGNQYILTVEFGRNFSRSMNGFYVSSYKTPDGGTRELITTQFEDTHARSAFPCFDEPAMKATFRLRLEHANTLTALSNTKIISSEKSGTTRVVDTFDRTPRMSTYLLAFIVCDFDRKSIKFDGDHPLKINAYAVPHKINQIDLSLEVAKRVVKFYESFFDIKYPLEKLDLVAIPDFAAGAMENWGLMTFRESTMLFDPQESSLLHKTMVVEVVAHEIAHQWFGNLVTMTWWDELWLNEGFATFMEYLASNGTFPEHGAWDDFQAYVVQSVLHKDTLESTHPVVADVTSLADIHSRFDDISYSKGASVLRMLFEALSPQVFKDGVSKYLREHTYANARTSDLWTALNDVWKTSGRNEKALTVSEIANSWTTQPGYPVITAELRDSRTLFLEQNPVHTPKAATVEAEKWIVPVSVITSKGQRFSKWMTEKSLQIDLEAVDSSTWFKLNVGQTGYYRVHYGHDAWQKLVDYLKNGFDESLLPPADRANLLDDAFSLVRIEMLNTSVALNLASYMKSEHHYLPWLAVSSHIASLEGLLYGTEHFRKFRLWRTSLIKAAFPKFDCTNVEDSATVSRRRLCIQLFEEACEVGHEPCVTKSKELFSLFRTKQQKVPADIRRTVYRTGIRYGNAEDWEFLWNRYLHTPIASEKGVIMAALTNTMDIGQLQLLVNYSLNSLLVRPADTISCWMLMSMNYYGRDVVWKAVRHNWNLLLSRYGDSSAIGRVFESLQWMTSVEDLSDLKAFFDQPGRSCGAGARAYQQTVETIELRKMYLDYAESDIARWLNSQDLNS